MNIHNFEIDMKGLSVAGSTVKMNGIELDEVVAFEVPRVDANSISVIKLELLAVNAIKAIAALDLTLSIPESLPFDPASLMFNAMAGVDGMKGEYKMEGDPALQTVAIRFLELVIENSGIEKKPD